MKELYICEKCGRQFDNYNDAWACENSHATPTQIMLPELCDNAYEFKYAVGCAHPERIVVQFPRLDEDGWQVRTEDADGQSVPVYDYVAYVPQKVKADDVHTLNAAIANGISRQEEKNRLYWENWEKEHNQTTTTENE